MRFRGVVGLLVLAAGCGQGTGAASPSSTAVAEPTTTVQTTTTAIVPTSVKIDETRPPEGFALVLRSGKTVRFYDFGTQREATTEVSPVYSVAPYGPALFAIAGGARSDDYVSEYWLLPSPGFAVKLPVQEGLSVGPTGEIWGWVVGEATPPGFRLIRAMNREGKVRRSFYVPQEATGPMPIRGGAVVGVDRSIYFLDTEIGVVQLIASGQLRGVVGERFDWTQCSEGNVCTRLLSTVDRRDETVSSNDEPMRLRLPSPDAQKYVSLIAFTGTFEVHDVRSEPKPVLSYHYGTMCGAAQWSPDSVWFVVFDCEHTVVAINTVTGLQFRLDTTRFGTIDRVATFAAPQRWIDSMSSPWPLPSPTIVRRLPYTPCPSPDTCSVPRAA